MTHTVCIWDFGAVLVAVLNLKYKGPGVVAYSITLPIRSAALERKRASEREKEKDCHTGINTNPVRTCGHKEGLIVTVLLYKQKNFIENVHKHYE